MDAGEDDTEKRKEVLEAAAQSMKAKGFVNYFGTQRFGKFRNTHLVGIAVLQGDFEKAVETARKYVLPPPHHPKRRARWVTNMTEEARKRLEKAQNVSETAVTKGWLEECPDADSDCWQ